VQEQLASLRAALRSQDERLGLQFKDAAAAATRESHLLQCWPRELQASQAAMEQALAAETLVLCDSLAKLSATAGTQASHLEGLSGELQRMQQLESQLAECRGVAVAVAESRDVQESWLR